MRFISTRTHQAIDCVSSLVFIISPWVFNFADGAAAEWIPIIIGILLFMMALCTNYGLGVIKIIPMKMHLTMDMIAGLILAISPWLFKFSDKVYLPHLILGILEAGAALMTNPETNRTRIPAP